MSPDRAVSKSPLSLRVRLWHTRDDGSTQSIRVGCQGFSRYLRGWGRDPRGATLCDGVEAQQELAHDRHQSHLAGFAPLQQSLMKAAQFNVTRGDVAGARRLDRPGNVRRSIRVRPDPKMMWWRRFPSPRTAAIRARSAPHMARAVRTGHGDSVRAGLRQLIRLHRPVWTCAHHCQTTIGHRQAPPAHPRLDCVKGGACLVGRSSAI